MDSELPPETPRRGRARRGRVKRLDRPRRVVLRDLIVYEIKLLLDGVKGVGISFLALAAVAFDMVRPGNSPGHRFYAVMRLGERLDRWLSLYGVAEAAEGDPEGMFGVSRAGSPTLLGRLEALIHHAVVGEEDEGADEAAEAGGDARRSRAPSPPAGDDDDLFSMGIAVLDRAVDALDRERPSPSGADAPAESGPDGESTDEGPAPPEAGGAATPGQGGATTHEEPEEPEPGRRSRTGAQRRRTSARAARRSRRFRTCGSVGSARARRPSFQHFGPLGTPICIAESGDGLSFGHVQIGSA